MKVPSERLLFIRLGKADFEQVRSVETAGCNDPWTDTMLKDELSHANAFHRGVSVSAAGGLCAYILCRLQIGELHIYRLCTHPAQRRQGYAEALLSHALAAARSMGAARAFLEVGASNTAAVILYRRAGFSVDAGRKKYYPDGDDALVMSRQL